MFDPAGHLDAIDAVRWEAFLPERKRLRRLFDENPSAFEAEAAAAWRFFDTPRVVAAGSVRQERGVLAGDWGLLMARALLADGRAAEALDVLSQPGVAQRDAARPLYHRGRMFAADGDLQTAKIEFNAALDLDPEFAPAIERKAEVKRLQRLTALLATAPDWSIAAAAMADATALRSASAGREVAELFSQGAPAPTRDQADQAYVFIERALEIAPAAANRLIARWEAGSGETDLTRALRINARLKAGETVTPLELPSHSDWRLRLWNAMAFEAAGDATRGLAEADALTGDHDSIELRHAIAYCAGAEVLRRVPLTPKRRGSPRIVNLFPFNDEFVLLRAHLEEMSWVDRFILVEARQTFTGLPKPLAFEARKAEFADYAHKLTHVVVDTFPAGVDHAWARDFYQRDYAIAGLGDDWSDDDLVLLTDVDEIIDRKALDGFQGDLARLEMNTYRYFFNYRPTVNNRMRVGRTGAVCRARLLRIFGASYLRFVLARLRKEAPLIPDSGWHFTSVAEPAAIARKYRSYAHQEAKYASSRKDAVIERRISSIRGGKDDEGWERVPLDESFPAFIRDNAEALSDLIL